MMTFYSPFRSVSQCKDKLEEHKSKIDVFQDGVDDWCSFVSKRECSLSVRLSR